MMLYKFQNNLNNICEIVITFSLRGNLHSWQNQTFSMYPQSDYILFYYLCQISSLDNGTVGLIFNDSTVLKSWNLIIRHIILLNKFQPFVIVDYRFDS